VLLHELLSDTGSIYVHLDWHVGHYAKLVLDEVFGVTNFRNEIVREKANPKNYTKLAYGNVHDIILFYSKSENAKWTKPYVERSNAKVVADFPSADMEGKRYKTAPLHAPGVRGGETGQLWRGLMPPPGNHWRYIHATLDSLDKEGRIEWSSTGNPRERVYADESQGVFLQDIWLGVKDVKDDYPSAKNPELLERIVQASSAPDSLVLDCFCGSGTTAAVAERLGRRWITCDLGRFAVHTTRKRLLGIQGVKPFVVQNLGKYERQLWQADEFGPQAAQRVAAYTTFILGLYHAQPLAGRAWLHGIKGNRVVHIGSIDSPVTLADVRSIIIEWQRNVGKSEVRTTGIDVLGWDFAFELNEVARQQALDAGVDLKFYTIPREVLEKKAVEQGDIQFFELAALFVHTQVAGRTLTVELTNFVPPLDYIPQEVRSKITAWESWIDYWAVDFEFKGDTFHNEWQSYRTKANKAIAKKTTNTYVDPGTHCVNVKVIDILGNDTTRTLQVEIA